MLEKSFIADANIFIDAPSNTIAVPVDITCLALPVTLVNIASSVSNPAIAANPLPISSQLIPPNFSIAFANMSMEEANITIPMADDFIFLLNFAKFMNNANSAISAPTPTRPFAIPSQLIEDNFFIAPAKIRIATLIPIITEIDLITPFISVLIFVNIASEPNNSAKRTVIPERDFANAFPSIVEIANIDAANMPIATAILSRIPAFNCFWYA